MPGGQMPYHQPDSVKPKKEKPKKTRDTSLHCCCLPFITLLGVDKNTKIQKLQKRNTKYIFGFYTLSVHFAYLYIRYLSGYPVSFTGYPAGRISG